MLSSVYLSSTSLHSLQLLNLKSCYFIETTEFLVPQKTQSSPHTYNNLPVIVWVVQFADCCVWRRVGEFGKFYIVILSSMKTPVVFAVNKKTINIVVSLKSWQKVYIFQMYCCYLSDTRLPLSPISLYLCSSLIQVRDHHKIIGMYMVNLLRVHWTLYYIFSSSVCHAWNCRLDACDNYIMLHGNDFFPCGIFLGYCWSYKKIHESYPEEFNTKYIYRWVRLIINQEPSLYICNNLFFE